MYMGLNLNFNEKSIRDYYWHSCLLKRDNYILKFNGTTNSDFVSLKSTKYFLRETQQKGQCGPIDNRIIFNDTRIARGVSTSTDITDNRRCSIQALSNGAFAMSGHCQDFFDNGSMIEFNVPISNTNGDPNPSSTNDQYPMNLSSMNCRDVGREDFCIFGVSPNANTGLLPAIAQDDFLRVTELAPNLGSQITIRGYGTDDGSNNRVLQTHTGPNEGRDGDQITYKTDTTNGNSGSPILRAGNLQYSYGIHNNGGCNTDGTGANRGLSYNNSNLSDALNSFYSQDFIHADLISNSAIEDGSIFRPYNTIEEVNQRAGELNSSTTDAVLVRGTYNEDGEIILNNSMLMHAPVGDVLIK